MNIITPSFNRNKNAHDGLIIHPTGAAGGTIRDESLYTRLVTPGGSGAIIADGRFGKGLQCRKATSDFYTIAYSGPAHDLSFWIKFYDRSYASYMYCQTADANNYIYTAKNTHVGGNILYFRAMNGGVEKAYYNTAAWTPFNGTDYFFEFTRSGANFYIFIDGASMPLTTTTPIGANDIGVGANPEINLYRNDVRYGDYCISEVCLLKGRAWHTAEYTRPTRRR
jgi:hypothetical protein